MQLPWGLRVRAWMWMVGDTALLLSPSCCLSPPHCPCSCIRTYRASSHINHCPQGWSWHRSCTWQTFNKHGAPVDCVSGPATFWPQSSIAPCDGPCNFSPCSPLTSCLWCQPLLLIPSGSVPEQFLLTVFHTSLLWCILSLNSPEKEEGNFPLCRLSTAVGRALSSGLLMGHWESWPPGKTAVVGCGTKQEACKWTDRDWKSPSGCSEAEPCLKLAGVLIPQEGNRMDAGQITQHWEAPRPQWASRTPSTCTGPSAGLAEAGSYASQCLWAFLPSGPISQWTRSRRTSRDQSLATHFLTRNRNC